MRTRGLCRASVAGLVVALGACGGKLAAQEFDRTQPGAPTDASAADAGHRLDDCPSSRTLVELGAACAWTGSCTVPLDVCGEGVGISVATRCEAGVVVMPAGTTPGCPPPPALDASFPRACPGDVVVGAACAFHGGCEVAYCGPTEPLLACTCTAGVWRCPGASTCAPTTQCAAGAACAAGLTTCVVPGAGPCGSDARLVCTIGLRYAADGFLCDDVAMSCAVHRAGADGGAPCNESCRCENGLLACNGSCPGGS